MSSIFLNKTWLMVLVVIAVAWIFFISITYAGTLSCTTRTGSCAGGEVEIFELQNTTNSHVGLPAASYNNLVCCSGVTGLGNSCSGNFVAALKLSGTSNAHARQNSLSDYTSATNACISVPTGSSISVGYQATNCTGYDTTLGSMIGTTNSHVGNSGWASGTTKICATGISGAVSVGASGVQHAGVGISTTDNYAGGAFTFIRNTNSADVTQIIIAEKGTINANTNLSNLKLSYKQQTVCSSSIPNGTTAFNTTGVSFNASDIATITGTMSISTSQVCVYATFDVGSGASLNDTIELEITNPSTDVTASAGNIMPATVIALASTTRISQVYSWPFTSASDYTYDSSKISISGGIASLVQNTKTDSDNTADGFGGGTHSNTQWYTGSNWVGLDATGLAAGSGNFTSRIMDAGGSVSWAGASWTTYQPNYKELPDNAATETVYTGGNAAMNGNVLLMHMNETSGTISDTSGNNNNGTNSGATYASTGQLSSSLSFDGSDDSVTVADSDSLDFSSAFTAEAWIKFNSTFSSSSGANMGLVDKSAYQLFFDKIDGKMKLALESNNGNWVLSNDSAVYSRVRALAVYNNKLYAGMGGSIAGNGDVYVFDGTAWALSYDGAGKVFSGFSVYNGNLYAGQGGAAGDGDVYKFDGTSWTSSYNVATTNIFALAVYANKLYEGMGDLAGNGDILSFDNTSWAVAYNGTKTSFYSLGVYNNKLYAGQGGAAGDGDVLVYDGTSWATSFDGASQNIFALTVYNDKLYIGQGGNLGEGDIYVFDGTSWAMSYDGSRYGIYGLAVYNDKLYAGQGISTAGFGDIYVFDGSSWVMSYDGSKDTIYALAVYNGKLYAGQRGPYNKLCLV